MTFGLRLLKCGFTIQPERLSLRPGCGAGGGIRTHGPLRASGFLDRRTRPLCDPRKYGAATGTRTQTGY